MTVAALDLSVINIGYIDPNAGGLLFQLLFPVFVAIGGVWMVFRRKIGAVCKRLFRRGSEKDDAQK